MARHYGVTVKAYNVSREQIRSARQCAKAEGLDGRVEFIDDDYRAIPASLTSLPRSACWSPLAPGNYRCLGEVIDRCLRPSGRGMIHSIGRDDEGEAGTLGSNGGFSPATAPRACGRSCRSLSPAGSRCWTWRTCGCTTR